MMRRHSRTSLLALVLVTAAPLPAQQEDIGPPPGQLVDVGGRKLHMVCSGTGAPTVILEAGASAFAIDWTLVQREIARTHRVCSYDRAGQGWSDASAANWRPEWEDLHVALDALREKPPYIMVGASRGGLLVRRYDVEFPNEVAGMVLIDPAHEDRLFTMFQGKGVTIAELTGEQLRSTISLGTIPIPRRRPQTGAPFDLLPTDLYEMRIRLDRKLIASFPDSVTYAQRTLGAERERAMLATLREIRKTQEHPLGDRPFVVLSRGSNGSQDLWDVHATAARLSTNSRHTVVSDAGHEIHLFRPDVVIQAILDVATSVRTKAPLPPR
jgi:pimeloyl-ACP methyl ester carboxylesterase